MKSYLLNAGITPLILILATACLPWSRSLGGEPLRAGIIGCDTSHATAFAKLINAENHRPPLGGVRVVAAFPGGSQDIPASRDRVKKYTDELRASGIQIVDSIDELIARVDVVLLESVDGRPHLQQVRPVLAAKKPVFIDKPLAGTLADAVEIVELAKKHETPIFSSSALRFTPAFLGARDDADLGGVVGCVAYSPCTLEPHHPDLFWYGIHGVETLFTIMGPGCDRVTRIETEGTDIVVGVWKDGRVGSFHGQRTGERGYGALIFGEKSHRFADQFAGYEPMLEAIAKFFETGDPPISTTETLEIYAFMEAADESKRQGGLAVSLETVMAKARAEVAHRRGS